MAARLLASGVAAVAAIGAAATGMTPVAMASTGTGRIDSIALERLERYAQTPGTDPEGEDSDTLVSGGSSILSSTVVPDDSDEVGPLVIRHETALGPVGGFSDYMGDAIEAGDHQPDPESEYFDDYQPDPESEDLDSGDDWPDSKARYFIDAYQPGPGSKYYIGEGDSYEGFASVRSSVRRGLKDTDLHPSSETPSGASETLPEGGTSETPSSDDDNLSEINTAAAEYYVTAPYSTEEHGVDPESDNADLESDDEPEYWNRETIDTDHRIEMWKWNTGLE